eukprot:snap_masked-scaffold_8-processed-gene-5.39-mRNA-1 protein AED:1.00 eAED:1.00 QI:0/0/0/0/1/1/2/0/98
MSTGLEHSGWNSFVAMSIVLDRYCISQKKQKLDKVCTWCSDLLFYARFALFVLGLELYGEYDNLLKLVIISSWKLLSSGLYSQDIKGVCLFSLTLLLH